ncbi:hypothetical protein ACFYYY_15060 [Streptomyces sp. NPDC001834]|uniref:hypothetical protein n=1 Tax=Streptomyces sp. NPDC001834 TaxID=3364616 RepID=UPI003694AB84
MGPGLGPERHFGFTDPLAEQFGPPADPDGPLSRARSVRITRDYVAAFLGLQLKGRHPPLLGGPTPTNPEVVFQQP